MLPLPVLNVPFADWTRVRLPCVVRFAVPVVPRIVPVVPRMVLFAVPQLLPIAIVGQTNRICEPQLSDREHFGNVKPCGASARGLTVPVSTVPRYRARTST